MRVETKFQNRSARVILVDPSGPVRQLLTDCMKSIGFENSQAVASIADAHSILETESADWLVVPLSANHELNGLHSVRMAVNFAELSGLKVSFLIEESELFALGTAFEFGLFSYHLKPFTKDSLKKEFEYLFKTFELNDWDATLTSAHYLRRYLGQTGQGRDLLPFERSLLEIYPGNTDLLIHLAEALHVNGEKNLAQSTLHQVEFIKPAAGEKVRETWKSLFGDEPLPDTPVAPTNNLLRLKSVTVIDSDDAVRSTLKNILTEVGCPEIQDFATGDDAFEGLKKGPEPSLIIMEWRIPKVSGPLLIQRIRSQGLMDVPIIIHSSLLKPSDMGLVREMGVANLALKPADRETILRSIIWTIQQDRLPTDAQSLELKIRTHLIQKNLAAAEELLIRYFNTPEISPNRKAVMQSEYALAQGNYREARDLAIDAIKIGGDSIFALNVLGKSLMVLRDFDAALKCFKKAQSMSPSNLERLVTIAEVHAELRQSDEANEAINLAKDIDPESSAVKEGEAKVAIAGGDTVKANEILGQMENMTNVIGYLNNKAVASSRCGFSDEGILIYQQTLASIPPNRVDIRAIVTYNLALAKVRKGDLQAGVKDLERILALKGTRIHHKASDLKERLELSITGGEVFSLKEGDSKPDAQTENHPESQLDTADSGSGSVTSLIQRILELSPGDHCCYLLFKSSAPHSPALEKLMAIPPKFKARKALERGETFAGADGTKTAS